MIQAAAGNGQESYPPRAAVIGDNGAPKTRKIRKFRHACPECAEQFIGSRDAVFCSPAHKNTHGNRSMKRGRIMVPLVLAWRAGKSGSEKTKGSSKWAFSELCRLADRWNKEDRDAGRAPMGDYLLPKINTGWTVADLG